MTKGPKFGRRRISTEDRALWEKVIKDAQPLANHDNASDTQLSANPTASVTSKFTVPEFRIGTKAVRPDTAFAALPSRPARNAGLDRKNFERLKKGKLLIDGRLDLHGMTLAQAHPALVGFVLDAQTKGKRLLLVITGKGRPHAIVAQQRGLLRRQVPLWLGLQPLASAILEVLPAQRKHGGDGAFYVYLKRRR